MPLHNHSGKFYRVFDVFDKGYSTGLEVVAVHDRCVEFNLAFVCKDCSASRVKQRKILERANRRLDRVNRLPSFSRMSNRS